MKKKLNGSALLILFALSLATAPRIYASTPPRAPAELTRLQGYWEGDGPGGKYSITITGNSLHFYARADFWYETTFTLPSGTNPQQLHATITKDSLPPQDSSSSIGTVVVAIFKIENGTLTLAVNQDPEGPPPSAFPDGQDSEIARYDLRRVEPEKNNTHSQKPPPPKTP